MREGPPLISTWIDPRGSSSGGKFILPTVAACLFSLNWTASPTTPWSITDLPVSRILCSRRRRWKVTRLAAPPRPQIQPPSASTSIPGNRVTRAPATFSGLSVGLTAALSDTSIIFMGSFVLVF